MKTLVIGILLGCLLIWLSACRSGPQATPSATAPLPVTVEPSPIATVVAWQTVTPHVFCEGAQESYLIVGERGRVTLIDDGKWLNLRAGPGIDFAIIARMAPLEDFLLLDGPRCGGPYTWFQVDYRGTVGWMAEGVDGQYFAEPWLPG